MLSGTKKPVRTKKAGISVSRKISAVFVASRASQMLAQERQLLGIVRDPRDPEERVEDDDAAPRG